MSDIEALLAKMKAARGSPQGWVERENAVSHFIAAQHESSRVFCRGEVHLEKGHFPAVLIFNSVSGQTWAWAPSGRKNAIEHHLEKFFWSNIPHVGIAREVLAGPEGTAPASGMEARQGEDGTASSRSDDSPARKVGDAQP